MNQGFSRERIDKWVSLEYYGNMGEKQYLQKMGPTTPELAKGPFLAWSNENKPYNELATLENQNLLIGLAKENPYGYSTLEECMHAVTPYLFLPIEEEQYLDTLVAILRDYQEKTYRYEKDAEGKVIFVKPYNHDSMHEKINELLQGHPLRQKYGYYANSMVLSWKQSKNREKSRRNIRSFLITWAKEKIWNNWKTHHRSDIVHMTQKKISDVFSVPGSLDIHTSSGDLIKNPPMPSPLSVVRKPKKKFDKNTLTSLFQRTGDPHLDNLLDHGREIVDANKYPTMQVKPTQILLRKYDALNDHDRPRHYQYMPYTHATIKKYYNVDGRLKEKFQNPSSDTSIPSIEEVYRLLIA